MRAVSFGIILAVALAVGTSARAELEPKIVTIEPRIARPGQTIVLRWYFSGVKIVVSGGRFRKGAAFTGKTQVTDRPEKTTRYAVDVWYKPKADPATRTVTKPLQHVQYTAVATVERVQPYRAAEGFDIQYLSGWHTDSFAPQSGGKVYYFQPEEDSVERLAVAVLPKKIGESAADIMEKVKNDVPSHYTQVEYLKRYDLLGQQENGQILTFRGIDQTHPNTRTESIVIVQTNHEKAYVISARTHAAKFGEREPLLDGLVRSFAITNAHSGR